MNVTHDPRSLFPSDRFGDIEAVERIGAGISGAVVSSVTTTKGRFVLRLQEGDREDWRRTVATQREAARVGVAPELLHVDEAQAASVSVRVEGIALGAALAQPSVRPVALADLVKRLAALHATPFPAGVRPPDLATRSDELWRAQVGRPGFPAWAIGLGERLGEARDALASDPRRVFSHGDLHPMNVVWDGSRVWLLDWERSGLAHPYSDLATLSCFACMPDDAALELVAAQEGEALDASARRVFRAARDRCRIVYGAVFLSLVHDLTCVAFADRGATLTLPECYQRMAAGTLSVVAPTGQALLGAALLSQCEP